MKISSNIYVASSVAETCVKQNSIKKEKSDTEKINVKRESFYNDRIVSEQSDRTAEACGLVTGKNFTNKTTVAGADGSVFSVRSYYDASGGNSLGESYENVLLKKANGIEVSNYDLYISNLTADITSYFSTASSVGNDTEEIKSKMKDVLAEIGCNIQEGKDNPFADLQTTMNLNGVEWKFSDMLNTMSVMEQGLGGFKTKLSLDYSDYAEMGVAIGIANAYAKENLNEEQCRYVNDIMQSKTNYLVQRQNEWVSNHLSGDLNEGVNSAAREKYYSLGSYKIATNTDLANEIKSLFSEVDYSDENDFSLALQKYKDLLRPVKLADGTDASKISQILQKNANNIVSVYANCKNALNSIGQNSRRGFETFA